VGPRAGLADVEKLKFLTLQGLELRPLSRPAHSLSALVVYLNYKLAFAVSGSYYRRLLADCSAEFFGYVEDEYTYKDWIMSKVTIPIKIN
jgi:hypothetical protein